MLADLEGQRLAFDDRVGGESKDHVEGGAYEGVHLFAGGRLSIGVADLLLYLVVQDEPDHLVGIEPKEVELMFGIKVLLHELEAWAAREGYNVLEVIEDGAWSGASLVRPGLDELRELVAAGGVDAVVTLFRDRLARGVYADLLAEEFAEYGCKLIALNTQVDDSPEGELHGGMLDIIANWERKKIAERTRRGKLQKARQGKIIANHSVNYGFKLNAARDGYIVDERDMEVVRRIFYLVGAQGQPMYAAKRNFEREGLPSPTGKKSWSLQFIRKAIQNDVYRPHTFEEVKKLVAPEVAARLDPNERYGIW